MQWVKLYTDILGDVKLTRGARRGLKGLALLPWLLAFAAQADDAGRLTVNGEPADPEDIAPLIPGETARSVVVALASLTTLGILVADADGALRFNAWAARAEKPSNRPDNVRTRVQKHRDRKRAESGVTADDDVTPSGALQGVTGNAVGNATEGEEEEEGEEETEKINSKSLKAPRGAPRRRTSAPASPRKPKGEPAPWMSVMLPIWRETYGGAMPVGAAQSLRPLVAAHGEDTVAAHLAVYCARTPAEFVSVPKFAQTFGSYAPGGAVESGRPALTTVPHLPATASADDVTTRREAQALYDTLRAMEVAAAMPDRAKGMFRAAMDRGTLTRDHANATFLALYGRDGAPPADGGALRSAVRDGRAGDAVRALEAIVRPVVAPAPAPTQAVA